MSELELNKVLGWLGYSTSDFARCAQGPRGVEGAQERLSELKTEIRKASRRLYFELHPDRCEVPDAHQRISDITDMLRALDHIQIAQTRPAMRRVANSSTSATCTSTTTWSPWAAADWTRGPASSS